MSHVVTGNGFTFEAHTIGDYIYAVKRAMTVYNNPQQYEKLRANAQKSVLDTAIVAEAWTRLLSCLSLVSISAHELFI